MNPTEHSPLGTRVITGLFGMFGGFSRTQGTRAPAAIPCRGRVGDLNQTTISGRQAKQASVTSNQLSVAGYKQPFVFVSPATLLISLVTSLSLLALSAPAAFAARGHVFSRSFKPEGEHAFSEPAGVAVNEATNEVLVADRANNRVESFDEKGEFLFQLTGANATGSGTLSAAKGTGDLTAGSETVEGVATSEGTFAEGQSISGPGITPGTVILAVGAGTLTLSAPAEEPGGTGVELTAGSTVVTGVLTLTGAFTPGEEIEGEGIPANTIILGVGPETLELSQPATKAGEPVLAAKQGFSSPEAVAVDNTCSLHNKASEEACAAPDRSSGDVYAADVGNHVVDKFTATGSYVGQLAGFPRIEGVGVDSRGEVWVAEPNAAQPFTDAEVAEPLPAVGTSLPGCENVQGFAVDAEDDLYSHSEAGNAPFCGDVTKFSSGGALLDGAFDPEGADWLAVELSTSDVYVDHGASLDRRAPDGSLIETLGSEPGPGNLTNGTGVAVSSASERVYVADPTAGEVFEYAQEPVAAPKVASEAASKVTGDSATLEGEVNPRSVSGEPASEYHFEYITEAAYRANLSVGSAPFEGGIAAPERDGSLPADFNVHTLTPVNVQHLQAGTTYHFRVVAANHCKSAEPTVLCATAGEQRNGMEVVHAFTTQTAGEFVLPDARQWEMVSPSDKHGALIEPLGKEVSIQASATGAAMAFSTGSPTESAPDGYAASVQVLSVRGADAWSSRDLTVPHETASRAPVGSGSEFRLFSSDLSRVLVQPQGNFIACALEGLAQPCLSPEATEQTAFRRDDTVGVYTPLVTPSNDAAEPFQPFGQAAECAPPTPKQTICGPEFVGAAPDLSHVVLTSSVALSSPAGANLYEWSPGEQLAPVSVLPADEGGSPTNGVLGANGRNVRQAVSANGARVFWSTGGGGGAESVYVRDVVKGETLRVTPGNGEFEDASSDGSRVLYEEGGSLDECHIVENAKSELECVGPRTELGSGLLGTIPGESEDGSWVYFVATSVLAQGAVSGEPNLYVRHAGETRLVAVLTGADSPDWAGAGAGDLGALIARVSPDGQWLAFMSQRGLTGYDTRDAVSGAPDEEVYLYNAESGKLVCASCDPSGARPVGEEGAKLSLGHGGIVTGEEAWNSSTPLAADVPSWNPYRLLNFVYQPRSLSDSGRLFFDARDSLVPQAVNGNWDVYEYEPAGVPATEHACTSSSRSGSETFKPEQTVQVEGREVTEGAGCVALISSGESGQESAFLDASQDGSNVFFMTTAKLSKRDTDNSYDVYDAHECSGAAPCFPPAVESAPPCTTEASCKAAPESQPLNFGSAGSATFSGAGNPAPSVPVKPAVRLLTRAQKLANALKVCKRDQKKGKRQSCEKRARSKYGPVKQKKAKKTAKKSSTDRRTSR